jgi:hypothetical protein
MPPCDATVSGFRTISPWFEDRSQSGKELHYINSPSENCLVYEKEALALDVPYLSYNI